MIFARKINKIPEFFMIFARKMPEFYIIIARKIFFSNFRGTRAPVPPSPMPMEGGKGRGGGRKRREEKGKEEKRNVAPRSFLEVGAYDQLCAD